MNEQLRNLTRLVRIALDASDAIGRDDVGIHLNEALVALDGIGDAGIAIDLLGDFHDTR